jgi:hypothetical protein
LQRRTLPRLRTHRTPKPRRSARDHRRSQPPPVRTSKAFVRGTTYQ